MTRPLIAPLRQLWATHGAPRWQALSSREQRLLSFLGSLLGLALAWAILLAPAQRTLAQSDAQRAQLAAQLSRMLALQSQAQALQQRPAVTASPWTTVQSLTSGNGWTLQAQGSRVTVQLKAVSATALATWLAQVREQARALPLEVHLQRNSAAPNAWDGSVVLRLPEVAAP